VSAAKARAHVRSEWDPHALLHMKNKGRASTEALGQPHDTRSETARDGGVTEECARLWGIGDVSRYLGVPVATIYQWRVRGEGPPAMRMGKHLRFEPRRVRAWAAAQSEDLDGRRSTR